MSSTRTSTLMAPVELVPRELNLSAYGHDAFVDKLNIVPGLRTSTAFFTFLRANLVATSSPYLGPTSSYELAASAPTPSTPVSRNGSASSSNRRKTACSGELLPVPDDLPQLSIGVLDDHDDKVDALELVSESVAEQRQSASRYLALHPCLLAGLTACLAATQQFSRHGDLTTSVMMHSGVVAAYFLSIHLLTSRYSRLAKGLQWPWLLVSASDHGGNGDESCLSGDEDTVVGLRSGSKVVGTLVLRLEGPNFVSNSSPTGSFGSHSRSPSNSSISSSLGGVAVNSLSSSTGSGGYTKRHRARNNSTQLRRVGGSGSGFYAGKGVIRAWTVKPEYRGKGAGADLLNEAVRLTRERCGRDATVGFAKIHANSDTLDLPEIFCGHVRRAEKKATQALEEVLKGWEGAKRRRKL